MSASALPIPETAKAVLAAAGLALVLAGCATTSHPAAPTATGGQAPATTGSSTGGGSGPIVANGHGWSAGGLDGTIPARGSCHIRWTAEKEPLPDPNCTPGAVDGAVSAATLTSTICRKGGYTSSVRPPASLTDQTKRQLLAAYGIPASETSKYELDHLIPLDAGGASDLRNLWPQPNTLVHQTPSTYVHNDKDALEADAQAAICTGTAQLTSLQKAFATDWTTINLPHTTRNE